MSKSVRLLGDRYRLHQSGGRFWCVCEEPARIYGYPGGKVGLPRDVKGQALPIGPDRLMYRNAAGQQVLWGHDTRTPLHQIPHDGKTPVVASPDGAWVTLQTTSLRMVVQARDGQVAAQTRLSSHPCFSPDGTLMGLWVEDTENLVNPVGCFHWVDLGTKKVSHIALEGHSNRTSGCRFLTFLDRDRVLTQDKRNRIRVYSVSERSVVGGGDEPEDLVLAASGEAVLLQGQQGLRLREPVGLALLGEYPDAVTGVFSVDARWLALHRRTEGEHLLEIYTVADLQKVASYPLSDPAFDEFDPDYDLQLAFDFRSSRLAALANGEELRVWSCSKDRWSADSVGGRSDKAGRDSYVNLDVMEQTLNVASTAIKGLGGFFSKALKKAKQEEPQVKKRPVWLKAPDKTYPDQVCGEPYRHSPELALEWARQRAEQLRARGPDILPRSKEGVNNRAILARLALQELEPFFKLVEEQEPPYKLTMDQAFSLFSALETWLSVHPRTTRSLMQMFGFFELITRGDYANRKRMAQFFDRADLPELTEFLQDMEDPEDVKRKEIEKARALVKPQEELSLWVIPDIGERAQLEPSEREELERHLLGMEDELRTACARFGTFNQKVREERAAWLVKEALKKPGVEWSPGLKEKLERSF